MELALPLSPISVPSVLAHSDSDLCFRMILAHIVRPLKLPKKKSSE